ncbi:hypothetical protein [Blattabacterium cuenoti]|nr:hypothetical protein [Blattabacterium cuenoti]
MKINEKMFFEKKKVNADTLAVFIMEINKYFPKIYTKDRSNK